MWFFSVTVLRFTKGVKVYLQPWTKHLRQTLVFLWNSALWEKFITYFFRNLVPVLTKISFWEDNRGIGYNFVKFRGLAYIS